MRNHIDLYVDGLAVFRFEPNADDYQTTRRLNLQDSNHSLLALQMSLQDSDK